ncbi:tyrosine-type recombinase/integrase [Chitinophaga sp. Hz27]|uniref:tyrosine-type recombinase/integrase n=1 Tax=Chitinophaga sp. Hz27 TaxID=3347169 RepID=UPI0035DA0B84
MKIIPVPSKNGKKIYYTLEWGKGPGERKATGIFTWATPSNQIQKNFNKEQKAILEIKAAQSTITFNSTGTLYIPQHRFKANFVDYYGEFVLKNKKDTNKSLPCSFEKFKAFLLEKERTNQISPFDITKNLCERFQQYLLDTLNGETPGDYFMRFKRVLAAATDENYYAKSPAAGISIKQHPSEIKDTLTVDEYKRLVNSHCTNHEVKKAAITSMYTGLRWCDIDLEGWQVGETEITLKRQSKTGEPLKVPLHPVARAIIGDITDPRKKVFQLPTADGANKILKAWVKSVGINKTITWHCLRHSVSDLLQAAGVDVMTVAAFLGQKTAKYVLKTYQRRVAASNMRDAASLLPS